MKTKLILLGAVAAFSFSACNSSSNENSAADSDTVVVDSIMPVDSVVVDTTMPDTVTL